MEAVKDLARTVADSDGGITSMTIGAVDEQTGEISSSVVIDQETAESILQTEPPPADSEFGPEEGGRTFLGARSLYLVACAVCERFPEDLAPAAAAFLSGRLRLAFLWRRYGTEEGGKTAVGQTRRASGIAGWALTELAELDGVEEAVSFAIWLSAAYHRINPGQVERTLFHELKHLTLTPKGKWILRGHDLETFADEVRRFGLRPYDGGMERVADAFRQLVLVEAKPNGDA